MAILYEELEYFEIIWNFLLVYEVVCILSNLFNFINIRNNRPIPIFFIGLQNQISLMALKMNDRLHNCRKWRFSTKSKIWNPWQFLISDFSKFKIFRCFLFKMKPKMKLPSPFTNFTCYFCLEHVCNSEVDIVTEISFKKLKQLSIPKL